MVVGRCGRRIVGDSKGGVVGDVATIGGCHAELGCRIEQEEIMLSMLLIQHD